MRNAWLAFLLVLVAAQPSLGFTSPHDEHDEETQFQLSPGDFLCVISTNRQRLPLAQASRAWRSRGIPAFFVLNVQGEELAALNAEGAKHNEVGERAAALADLCPVCKPAWCRHHCPSPCMHMLLRRPPS